MHSIEVESHSMSLKVLIFFGLIAISMALAQNGGGPPPLPDYEDDSFDEEGQSSDLLPDEDGFYRMDDMILDEIQYKYHFGTEEERNEVTDRYAIGDLNWRWPNAEIVYDFHPQMTTADRTDIENAIYKLNNNLGGCPSLR